MDMGNETIAEKAEWRSRLLSSFSVCRVLD